MSETAAEKNTRQWWETMCRKGRATICPECGDYTKSESGFHAACAKRAGVRWKGAK